VIAIDDQKALALVLLLTLILLLLHPDPFWAVKVPVTVLTIAGFAHEPLRRTSYFWFVIGVFLLAGAFARWYTTDNHRYLMGYWCIALSLSLGSTEPPAALRNNARWLIALCFVIATARKLASPDFLDGSFFHHVLLTDARFDKLTAFAGVTPEMRESNLKAVRALVQYASPLTSVHLRDTTAIPPLATALTWWTIAIESLLTVAFVVPNHWPVGRYRDLVLIVFSATTYAVAPVVGFGWTLLVMGFVQAENRGVWLRWAYIGAFALLEFYLLPWQLLIDHAHRG
jgi:hypothetical protein